MHKCDHSDFLEFCIFGYFFKSLFCLLLFLVFFCFFYPFFQHPSRFSPLLTLSATLVASAPLFPSSCPLPPFLFSSPFSSSLPLFPLLLPTCTPCSLIHVRKLMVWIVYFSHAHVIVWICVVGRIMAPQRCPHPNPWNQENIALHGRRNFTDVIKVKEFEKGRLSLVIQVGPISLSL